MIKTEQISNIETLLSPSLVVFEQTVKKNLEETVRIAGSPDRLRPHCKTHKMNQIINMAMDIGINKQKCATIAETEMLADCGCKDILIAYQLVGPNLQRLIKLTDKFPTAKFAVLVDCPQGLEQLGSAVAGINRTVDTYIDLNTGMRRTGIDVGGAAVSLYENIEKHENLNAAGFHWYDGHIRDQDFRQRYDSVMRGWDSCKQFQQVVEDNCKPIERIVACGTGSFPVLAEVDDPVLELSPGTVIFFDQGYHTQFPEMNFEPAARLLTRVVSTNRKNHLTLDLGHKACAGDPPMEKRAYFPDLPDARLIMQNEEHLVIESNQAGQFKLGDTLLAIPWHICPTTALHEFVYVVKPNGSIDTWKVNARNRVLEI